MADEKVIEGFTHAVIHYHAEVFSCFGAESRDNAFEIYSEYSTACDIFDNGGIIAGMFLPCFVYFGEICFIIVRTK